MQAALIYKLSDGAISGQVSVLDEATVILNVDASIEGYVLVEELPKWGEVYYDLVENEVRDRQEFPNFPQVGNALFHIPQDTLVTWPDGFVTTETDGTVEVEVDVAADVTFQFSHLKYFDKTVTISVAP